MELFEVYTQYDIKITKMLGNADMYLIGGTAIDYWCTQLNIKKSRNRSKNDLDFYTYANNKKINSIIEYLESNDFVVDDSDYMIYAYKNDKSIELDILKDYDKLPNYCFMKQNGIAIMSPVYLFSSKFNRYINTQNKKRKDIDEGDLIQLLHIIDSMSMIDLFESFMSSAGYTTKEEIILNSLINKYINNK